LLHFDEGFALYEVDVTDEEAVEKDTYWLE
jgi:hypothetical protein